MQPKGNIFINQFNSCKIYGGGFITGCTPPLHGVVLDLADCFLAKNIIADTSLSLPEKLLSSARLPYDVINVAWKDGADLPVGDSFWIDLSMYFLSLDKDVLICCYGGYGRTGTALCILYHYMKQFAYTIEHDYDYSNVVELIRDIYSENAVETIKQLRYIERICSIELPKQLIEQIQLQYINNYSWIE